MFIVWACIWMAIPIVSIFIGGTLAALQGGF